MNNVIYIGIQGSVLALAVEDGREIWRTRLKSANFVSVTQLAGRLFASVAGELYCLDPATGTVLWHNKLKGLGQGFVTIAGDGGTAILAATQAAAQAQQAAMTAAMIAATTAAASSS
jgi:outer membrane protein assembly factor BamB